MGMGTVFGRGLVFLLVMSVLSMVLNIIVVWICRLVVCVPGALSGASPLGECVSPVVRQSIRRLPVIELF